MRDTLSFEVYLYRVRGGSSTARAHSFALERILTGLDPRQQMRFSTLTLVVTLTLTLTMIVTLIVPLPPILNTR